jgi:hypothetical protein
VSTHEQPAISLEPLTFQLTDRDGDTITVTSADIAIVTTGAVPGDDDWHTATLNANGTPTVYVSVQVGPGGDIEPTEGPWTAWVRFEVGGNRPARRGNVVIT